MKVSLMRIVMFLVIFFSLSFFFQNAYAKEVTLTWDANSETDGIHITLAWGNVGQGLSYKVFYREEGQYYDYEDPAWEGTDTTCTIHNLYEDTTYFFVARAFAESGDSNEACYQFEPQLELGTVEIGEVSLDHNWKRVTFNNTFFDPVVVANPLSYNGSHASVTRIQNVDSTGFDIRVQEWNYLDGTHKFETVGYIVMEYGSYLLEDGTKVEAGKFDTDATASFGRVSFGQTFNQVPVVTSVISSFNEKDTVCSRLKNINTTGFDFRMQEQERNSQIHATETICYIAWEPSSGTVGDLIFEVDKTGDIINHDFKTIIYNNPFTTLPVFLADMQTTDGRDTANLRYTKKGVDRVDIKITEEQSRDSEIDHTSEVVGYMLFKNLI